MLNTQLRVLLMGCSTAKKIPLPSTAEQLGSVYNTIPEKETKKTPTNMQTPTASTCPKLKFFSPKQSALNNLEVEVAYNPLQLKSNLYKYLRSSLYKPLHRQQPQPREQRHQPKQVSPSPLCVSSLDGL